MQQKHIRALAGVALAALADDVVPEGGPSDFVHAEVAADRAQRTRRARAEIITGARSSMAVSLHKTG